MLRGRARRRRDRKARCVQIAEIVQASDGKRQIRQRLQRCGVAALNPGDRGPLRRIAAAARAISTSTVARGAPKFPSSPDDSAIVSTVNWVSAMKS
jgi:hypothetical protein